MSFWTLFKLFAALCVLAVMSFTGMLAYHVVVAPLGGVFEKIIPNPAEIAGKQPDAEFAAEICVSRNIPQSHARVTDDEFHRCAFPLLIFLSFFINKFLCIKGLIRIVRRFYRFL